MKSSYTGIYFLFTVCFLLIGRSSLQAETDYCQTKPVRTEAIDFPSKHAWDLFVWLNHPAIDKKIRRGVADCSKPVGSPNSTSVWETWRNAGTEVFLDHEPPEWDDNLLPDEKPGQTPGPQITPKMVSAEKLADVSAPVSMASFHDLFANRLRPEFSPGDGVFDDKSGGFGETRLNKVTYEFVRNECLYNRQATERYAQAIVASKKKKINLPPDSIEVKAAWLDFEQEKIPAELQRTYYSATYNKKVYGLVALHVLTKDVGNWFWATFHHKDEPDNAAAEMPDTYGRPKVLDGTVWENYVLGGTQTDFVDTTGKPSKLSDYYVEFKFQKSSCITCHSTASIATTSIPQGVGMPLGQLRAVCLLGPNQPPATNPAACRRWAGDKLFKPGTDDLVEERGSPLPEWYLKDGKETYFQTDFLYSIPFRAGQVEEKGNPPDRCKW
jgi:hypothetical protein